MGYMAGRNWGIGVVRRYLPFFIRLEAMIDNLDMSALMEGAYPIKLESRPRRFS